MLLLEVVGSMPLFEAAACVSEPAIFIVWQLTNC